MANLTVEQPRIDVLKVEVSSNVSIDRAANMPLSMYEVQEGSLFGAKQKVFIPKENDDRSIFDFLGQDQKPYVIAVTAIIESPMKLYVQNQNYSSVLFGSNDTEMVKNVVRFETQVKWFDLAKIMPVGNKPRHKWVITDFNNVLAENPIVG